MLSNSGKRKTEFYDNGSQQQFSGKVQFLKADYGYIRSRSKINGIRDITFNYMDVDPSLNRSLQVGDLVFFRVVIFPSGKFCAVDIRMDTSAHRSTSLTRSASPVTSLSSLESCSDDSSSTSAFDYPVCSAFDMVSYSEKPEMDSLSSKVDSFLQRVISRNFDSGYSSCWLEY